MKSLEQRVAALEEKVEKMLDCINRLMHTQRGMTVKEAGSKGGAAKTAKKKGPASLPLERRQEIARKAAAARWKDRGSK